MVWRPLRRRFEATPRVSGPPRSANGASSFHLRWGGVPGGLAEVSAVLEVVREPVVDRLYFWALQVGFEGGGAGHLGLQWHRPHPASRAVNWGGYDVSGRVLEGTTSPLPSATGNPNTRDLPWRAGRRYRLTIRRGTGAWRGEVTDVATGETASVRELLGAGDRLRAPMVWSEVFARCDDPSVVVRWDDFRAVGPDGAVSRPDRVVVSYQSHAEGGCDNTTVRAEGGGVVQVTNAGRDVPPGTVLAL